MIFDACRLIILFIPCAPVNSSHDWSMYFRRECPEIALSFTNGCDDICARNHIAHDPKWCFWFIIRVNCVCVMNFIIKYPVISPRIIITSGISLTCCLIAGSIIVIGRIHIIIAPNIIDMVLITIIGVLISFHSFIMNLALNVRGPHSVAIDIRIEYSAVSLMEKKIRNSINMLFVSNEALSTIMSFE